MKLRWQQIIPIAVVITLIAMLGYGLTRQPSQLPSALIGDPVPDFSLPTLASEREVLTDEALEGQVTMINVWASWCLACRAEHAGVAEIALRTGVRVISLDYKDTRAAALRWLAHFGNPFAVVAFDKQGTLAFDLGVSGVPETFIVGANGIIRHKVVGPITPKVMSNTLIPLLNRLKQTK